MRALSLFALALLVLSACDSAGSDDPTIGGIYAGQGTNGAFSLTVPADTESDPDVPFAVSGFDVGTPFSGTATYDFPTLAVTIQIVGQSPQFDCTVDGSGDSMACAFATGSTTITRP